MTSAPSACARVPVLLERRVASFDLRPPFHASRGTPIAPARADDRVVQDVREEWLRRDDVVLDVELHVLGWIHSLLAIRRHVVGNRGRDYYARFIENVVEHSRPPLTRCASRDDRNGIGL